jgi:drug/metabolite transporter (DMT)-like permease
MKASPPLLAVIAIFILSVMDAMIKGISVDYGTLQVVQMRFLMGALVITCIFFALFPGWPSWEVIRINGVRGFLVVFTALTFFYGLSVLPLAEALALSFLSPIFIAILGVVILKEKAGGNIILGLILGTAGMMVMVIGLQTNEAGPRPALGIAAAILSAFSYGLAIVLLRARALKDPVVTIVLIQHLVPAIIVSLIGLIVWQFITPGLAAVPKAAQFQPLSGEALLWFLALGLCGAFGHLILATAFSRAAASSLAPLDYTSLIWAVLFGYLFFHEVPGLTTYIGAVLIAAGAFVTTRGHAKAAVLSDI